MTLGQRFARFATEVVVRRPALWRVFRAPLRRQFDRLAPAWDERRTPGHLAPLEVALAALAGAPSRVLDVGTGTGAAAFAVARRWSGADVTGVDVSAGVIERARAETPPELAGRVRFAVADASALPFADGAFDLVTLANVIPFFDELARVVAPGGAVAFSFSLGPATPIYVPPERFERELGRRDFTEFAEFSAGPGTALLARKAATS